MSQEKLTAFIAKEFNGGAAPGLDDALLDSGVIDSLGLVMLAVFIEKSLGVKVRDTSLNERDFGSIRKMLATIDKTRASAGAARK